MVVGPVLRTIIDLHYLDLSGNKLEKFEVISELKTFIECTSELNSLNLSDCSLTAEFLEEILTQVLLHLLILCGEVYLLFVWFSFLRIRS